MDFALFVQRTITQDKRNCFAKYHGDLSFVPKEMLCFYRDYDPIDVEVEIDGATLRFVPALELKEVQMEYSQISNSFVFATNNGDPIFIHEGAVYTCPHGVQQAEWEKLADSLESYLIYR